MSGSKKDKQLVIHCCISGFRQSLGYWNGMLEVDAQLREAGHAKSVSSRVEYHVWRNDWSSVAEYYFALGERYKGRPIICIYAYSWGAGWGAIRLAKELGKRGLTVKAMVLCDPVYRHPLFLMRWRSLQYVDWPIVSAPKIKIPANVHGQVFSFYQRRDKPRGHLLVAADEKKTTIMPAVELRADHSHMDEQPEFRERVLQVASEFLWE